MFPPPHELEGTELSDTAIYLWSPFVLGKPGGLAKGVKASALRLARNCAAMETSILVMPLAMVTLSLFCKISSYHCYLGGSAKGVKASVSRLARTCAAMETSILVMPLAMVKQSP